MTHRKTSETRARDRPVERFTGRVGRAPAEAARSDVENDPVLGDQYRGIVVVDARDAGTYAAGHVPGAVSVPVESFSGYIGTSGT